MRARCFLCSEAAVHGPCEHAYAALILKGQISVTSGQSDAQSGSATCLAPTVAISRMVPKKSSSCGKPPHPSDAQAAAVSKTVVLGAGESNMLEQVLQAAGISRPSVLHRLHDNEATIEALAQADITSMIGLFGFKFSEAVRVQQCAREHIRTAMAAAPQAEHNAPDANMGSGVRGQIQFITAAAPSSWSGEVSGTVHASHDGKRPLCMNKDLKHAKVVTQTNGLKLCAHASGKCSAWFVSLNM